MRIALLTDGIFPYVVGGMQKHSYYFAKSLASLGHSIDLYHFKAVNSEIKSVDVFGDAAANISEIVVPFPQAGKLPLHYLRESKTYSSNLLEEYLKRAPADIIVAKGFTGWKFVGHKMNGGVLPPIAVNFHGYEMFQRSFSLKHRITQQTLRSPVARLTRNADYVFSYGGKITELLQSVLKIEKERILEFPSGIDKELISEHKLGVQSKRRFVFIGRYEPRKGINELHDALKHLNTADFSFDFIGDIPESIRVNNENFVYHDLMTNAGDISKVLRSAEVLVCPSWSEGMPNVILEGMANGLAVLGTDTGATNVLISEERGWLINSPEKRNLIPALERILKISSEELLLKRNAARQHVRDNFLWENIAVRIADKFEKIISERASRR